MLKPHQALLVLPLTFVLACDGNRPVKTSVPKNLDASGYYALTSTVDVPTTVLATSTANDFLSLLHLLRDDPAAALFAVLEDAGVPLAKDLYAVLPGSLKDVLRSAINDYVLAPASGDAGATSELERILALADATLTRFELQTTLTLPAVINKSTAESRIPAAHQVDAVVFRVPGGLPVSVSRAYLQSLIVVAGQFDAETMAGLLPGGNGDATLSLGDHFFGLAYGQAIFAALDGAGTGETLRARLGRAFNCPAMGKAVASRCISILCIGHASEITQICEQGLDQAVSQMHGYLADLNFRAVRFADGSSQLWDQGSASEPRDGIVHLIDEGAWKASIDVGTGARACQATFTGRRATNQARP